MKTLAYVFLVLLMSATSASSADHLALFQNLSPISGLTIVAKAKGFFDAQGLDVEVHNVTSGKLALDALIGGSAELATVAETPIMRAGLAGQALAMVATMEASDNDVQILARTDSDIKSISDLKGKKIATAIGTSAEYMVVKALASKGLKPSDATIMNLRPQDMATALERGDVDAYAIWQPHTYNGRRLLEGKAAYLDTKGIYVETFNIVGMRDYVQKNSKLVQEFLKALLDAEAFMRSNPEESTKIVAEALQMDVPTMAAIWGNFDYRLGLNADILELFKKEAEWDISSGKPVSVSDVGAAIRGLVIVDDLKAVAPERVVGF
jgi:ABC-type nitrate/sulfonate/bicarbonate transport system substrate-binding protein